MKRAAGVLVVFALGVAVGALAWWAAATLYGTEDSTVDDVTATVEALRGTVGRSVSLVAEAARERTPLPAIAQAGRLTMLSDDLRILDAGDVAFEIDLRPVVVAQGSTPAFRDLRLGTEGRDVAQLQELLVALGHDVVVDGRYGRTTADTVRRWQEELGVPETGVVAAGDILYVPALPLTVAPAPDVRTGDFVSPGTVVLDAISPEPRFGMRITDGQTDLVPLDAEVVVDPEGLAAPARIEDRIAGEGPFEGTFELLLTGVDGPLCPPPCEAVPADDIVVFPVDVVVVAETTGVVVPVSALFTLPSGNVGVRTVDGAEIAVTVMASAAGQAVVEGVPEGTVVELFGDPSEPES